MGGFILRVASIVSIALLGLLVLVPAVSAVCVPTCEVVSAGVRGTRLVFAPPVTVVQTGDTITWTSTDGLSHIASERGDDCFFAWFGPGFAGHAHFFVGEGGVHAAEVGQPLARCAEALALPDGSFLLDYWCPLHPEMVGRILVEP